MKKSYVVEGIDCANCAAKIENKINKIKGVNEATVNFMMSKMTIDAECDTEEEFEKIMNEVKSIYAKIEPDAVIKE